MEAEALKIRLIKKIADVDDQEKLKAIELLLGENSSIEDNSLSRLAKPMRKKLDLEVLKKEQNFKPINKEDFFKKIEALDIEESIDELLEMI